MTNAERRDLRELRGSRTVMVLGGLWLLAGVLAVRQAAEVLRLPPDERLTDLETWIGPNGVLHVKDGLYDHDTFTGTPFAGLVLKPLANAAEDGLGVVWTLGTLLLVAALGFAVARALPGPVAPRTAALAAPAAVCLLVLSLPVRDTLELGQLSILPVLLVVLACRPSCPDRTAGVLAGAAAALHPAMLLFAVFFWLTGRRPAAVSTASVFALCTALAWVALPGDSAAYWVHHVAGAGLGAPADAVSNQSLHGLLLRLGLRGPLELALFGALAGLVAFLGLRRAARYAQDGQVLLGVALTGCAAVAASPVAWQHQQLWVLLAAVGRVGRRKADRLVWPVFVVLLMTAGSTALLPNVNALGYVAENITLIAAVLAACAIPFLSKGSELWDRPVPTAVAPAPRTRFARIPLLAKWPRPLHRPNLMLELLLIRAGYWVYSYVRGSVPDQRHVAERHGRQILDIEAALRIDVEHWLNHQVVKSQAVEDAMNFFYSTFHFLVPLVLLGFLYAKRPTLYRAARSSLGLATMFGLVGFWLYPLAPPRLMPGMGYIDTIHGPQDLANPDFGALTKLSNQYAAMPSLHVGWALWCALIIAALLPWRGLRWIGLLYPCLTTLVIMGTANHYVLDAVGGVVVVAAGMALLYVLTGTSPFNAREPRPPVVEQAGAPPREQEPPQESPPESSQEQEEREQGPQQRVPRPAEREHADSAPSP